MTEDVDSVTRSVKRGRAEKFRREDDKLWCQNGSRPRSGLGCGNCGPGSRDKFTGQIQSRKPCSWGY